MSSSQTKILLLILAILFSLPLLTSGFNYIPVLSTGDHGRDFYGYQQILEGKLPYRDFWWVYGPLMLYYYALFFKILGIQMTSIIIGKIFLIIFCEIFFYLILARFTSPLWAFIGTLWFFLYNNDFFFTYNHIGGVVCLLASVYFTFSYLKDNKTKYLYLNLFSIFILVLIKINFGLSCLVSFIISIRLVDYFKPYPKQNLTIPISFVLLSTAIIYFLLLYKMPIYEIRQCFPYLSSDQPHSSTPWEAIYDAVRMVVLDGISSLPNIAFSVLIIMSAIFVILKILKRSENNKTQIINFLILSIIIIYYILNLHEYILSGTTYRAYWVKPLSILLVFWLIYTATKHLRPIILFLLYTTLIFNIFLDSTHRYASFHQVKNRYNFLNFPRGQVYISNEPAWIQTVMLTTQYLKSHLLPQETFFALPYDCLYYYLAEKNSPTRQLIFFDHINIPKEQEFTIIKELEHNKVNWVVVSSRSISIEGGLGKLGVTYCPLIGKYIADNFEIIEQFGTWTDKIGWGANHATRIMKRKNPI